MPIPPAYVSQHIFHQYSLPIKYIATDGIPLINVHSFCVKKNIQNLQAKSSTSDEVTTTMSSFVEPARSLDLRNRYNKTSNHDIVRFFVKNRAARPLPAMANISVIPFSICQNFTRLNHEHGEDGKYMYYLIAWRAK